MIGLIGAMLVEMEHLLLALEEHKEHKIGVMTLHTGQLRPRQGERCPVRTGHDNELQATLGDEPWRCRCY